MCTARRIPLINTHMGDLRYQDWDMDAAYGISMSKDGAKRSVSVHENVQNFFQKSSHPDEASFLQKLWRQVDWSKWNKRNVFSHIADSENPHSFDVVCYEK